MPVHLRLAQPALIRSLGKLGPELGTPLFQRHVHGMVLTPGATYLMDMLRRGVPAVAAPAGAGGMTGATKAGAVPARPDST